MEGRNRKLIYSKTWSNIIKKWEKTSFCLSPVWGLHIQRKGLWHLKTQGSNKIDGYCPAEIKVFVSETGACSIKFCKTHPGHRNDIGHLSLTDFERQHIATKIASKIPFDEIRDSVTDSKLERIHLLTKKKTCIILRTAST
ncbi:MULE domain-containing protein [Trichonephila clavipes]|nr:MULE domain-containing protein [Trichonephila clavipes]